MANFTAKDVNELRKSTGVGMMDCKKALTEADGDVEKAIELLREKDWLLRQRRLVVLLQRVWLLLRLTLTTA